MKLLLTTIAVVLLVGCGPSEADRALFKASQRGNIKTVKQHLAAGADVNAKIGRGNAKMTPLHAAIQHGDKEIVELLIAKGADVNAGGILGYTPLNTAVGEREKEIADLLRKHGGKTKKELEAAGK
jgi:cytohesin